MKMWICRDMDYTLWLSEGEPYLDEHCKGVLEYLDYIRDEKGKQ